MDEEMPMEEATFFSYRGEGAANIVLSYHGTNTKYMGKVLRIRKVPTASGKAKNKLPSPKDILSTNGTLTESHQNRNKDNSPNLATFTSEGPNVSDPVSQGKRDYPLLPTSESVETGTLSKPIANTSDGETGSDSGQEKSPLMVQVLSDNIGGSILSSEEQEIWHDWPEVAGATTTADLVHEFTKNVMQPLLGEEFVDPGTPVHVSRPFLEIVCKNISTSRPAWRAAEGQLALIKGRATLISDHSLFPSLSDYENSQPAICVEIKPKCGFLPSSDAIGPENEVKRHLSRFELHQHLKLSRGEVKGLSKYNPLDFFSGEPDRVLSAVTSLFQTPQNNLRVFKNGREVFGIRNVRGETDGEEDQKLVDKSSKIEKEEEKEKKEKKERELSSSVVQERLQVLDDELEGVFSSPNGQRVKILQSNLTEAFLQTKVLERLLETHKLDKEDIEGTITEYKTFKQFLDSNSNDSKEESLSSLDVEKFEKCRKQVQNFLIAATAKDCGLMATFRRKSVQKDESTETKKSTFRTLQCGDNQEQYEFKVSFVDLDMKSSEKIPSYLKLDQEIVKYYNNSVK